MPAGPQDGTQLGFEQAQVAQAQADAAHAEKRVALRLDLPGSHPELIGAEVEGPDDHRPARAQSLQDRHVSLKVLLLGRVLALSYAKEFRAIKPDAFAPALAT